MRKGPLRRYLSIRQTISRRQLWWVILVSMTIGVVLGAGVTR
jgi:uncharacterized membrane protein YhaH (DUF805 family)